MDQLPNPAARIEKAQSLTPKTGLGYKDQIEVAQVEATLAVAEALIVGFVQTIGELAELNRRATERE